MTKHLSSFKRIKQNQNKRIRNKYAYKSTKTAIKKLIKNTNKTDYYKVISMIDKLSKKNIIHINKASRIKKKLKKKLPIHY
ncbi:30S ribosomal protein S20 [Blattabacterium cuenoti]|uniref:30S ribosomal protein S20 n=1 Tax=Blattabacterium cuenoti TaxID=1653831 RepID=UPI00163D2A4E|nr:30S ribosomal protein S20 [Blattabacterium cuenoti]